MINPIPIHLGGKLNSRPHIHLALTKSRSFSDLFFFLPDEKYLHLHLILLALYVDSSFNPTCLQFPGFI